jgi:hypothetical protein
VPPAHAPTLLGCLHRGRTASTAASFPGIPGRVHHDDFDRGPGMGCHFSPCAKHGSCRVRFVDHGNRCGLRAWPAHVVVVEGANGRTARGTVKPWSQITLRGLGVGSRVRYQPGQWCLPGGHRGPQTAATLTRWPERGHSCPPLHPVGEPNCEAYGNVRALVRFTVPQRANWAAPRRGVGFLLRPWRVWTSPTAESRSEAARLVVRTQLRGRPIGIGWRP